MRRAPATLLSLTLLAIFATALGLPHHALAAIHLAQSNTTSLTNGLVGYWPLDGSVTNWATGVTRDIVGGVNGSLGRMSTTSSPTAGTIGQGMRFDNFSDARILTAFSQSGDGSISLWYNQFADVAGGFIDNSGDALFGRYIVSADSILFGVHSNGVTGNYPVTLGRWYHLTATWSGDLIKVYIDGAYRNTTDLGPSITLSLSSLMIGADDTGSCQCKLDDVRVYNRQLSAAEVKQLYNLGQAKIGHSNVAISNGLVGYWTFDGRDVNWATGKAKDLSGNGNDGSLALMSTSSSPTPGKIGQALKFNAARMVTTNYNVTAPFTVAGWVRTSHMINDSHAQLMATTRNGNNGLECGISNYVSPPDFFAQISNTTGGLSRLVETGLVATSTWYHEVCSFDGNGVLRLYVNGKLQGTSASGGVMEAGGIPLRFGSTNSNQIFYGDIDDMRLYNRALADSEIKQLYNLGTANVGHSNAMISDGLVGYWTFDGPSIDWRTNTVKDVSGQGNTGTLISMSTTSSPTPGKIGQAFKFNGSSNYVATTFNPFTSNTTFSAWFKVDNLASSHAIFASSNSGSGPMMRVETNGNILTWSNVCCFNTTYTPNIQPGKWYHVALTFDNTTFDTTLYINGNSLGVQNGGQAYSGSPGNLQIGLRGTSDDFFAGTIDDARFYNRILTAGEVAQLYSAGR